MNHLISPSETVGQIVARNFNTATVFEKYNIDFCCGGKKTLQTVCAEQHLNFDTLYLEVEEAANRQVPPSQNAAYWSLTFLTEYIVHTHHRYVQESIPVLLKYTAKIASVHGKNHPELIEVARLFAELAQDLLQHMKKEEIILFPYINDLADGNNMSIPSTTFGSVNSPIMVMEQEHETAGNLMHQIRTLTHNYTLPDDACNTYGVTFARLQEFETDLHRHVHLENNILFPKTKQLEQTLTDGK
ncbi:iron-sulfur cluster repair di-iron protein [Sphingobacteriales bacterium UPWRP_1]|nr:iron-sulfur cluster repair di-iron protein [Sphingobacteriales bacterium TSM_CSS]PSJ77548.1 iron-sulfur cluster repair di-iron protein [Sphingobacteriales bacterium UPWRP_1]